MREHSLEMGAAINQKLSLFRSEALSESAHNWLGKPRLDRALPVEIVSIGVVTITFAVILYLYFGKYTQHVRLSGNVTISSGILRIRAPRNGTVKFSKLDEYQLVAEGESLFSMDVSPSIEQGAAGEIIRDKLVDQQVEIRAQLLLAEDNDNRELSMLGDSLQILKLELGQYQAEIAATEHYHYELQSEYRDLVKARSKGIAIQEELDTRRTRLYSQKEKLHALKRLRLDVQQRTQSVNHSLNTYAFNVKTRRSIAMQDLARLDAEIASVVSETLFDIPATQNGRVSGIQVQSGQYVLEDETLVTLLPEDGEIEIHLDATDSAIAFVQPGDRVTLRYRAFPHQKFGRHGGTVKTVSHVPLKHGAADGMAMADTHRISVTPEHTEVRSGQHSYPLEVGMLVDCDIALESRRLYQWILSPLFDLQHRTVDSNKLGAVTNSYL